MSNLNVPAPNTSYFTPIQAPPAGTALDPQPDGRPIPKIFQPLRIRGVEFPNRIWLSPLCQYSAENGRVTAWHTAHLGGILTRGAGHTMIEATAVTPNGRITPEDTGIWSDDHIPPLAALVEFAHSQSQKIGIQLAHAGRKASTSAPFINGPILASEAVGGWPEDVWGPSAVPFDVGYAQPKELSVEDIKGLVQAFAEGAKRAIKAGFDVIEIHSAHGYLLQEFLSPISNKRTDEYGGSWENRIRFPIEVVDAVRAVIPESTPVFFRISATDWVDDEPAWSSQDTMRLAPVLYAHGVDLFDISSGGNSTKQKIGGPIIIGGPVHVAGERVKAYQAPLAHDVMNAVGAKEAYPSSSSGEPTERPSRLLVSAVGKITSGRQAEELLEEGYADVVMLGRQFVKDPASVWTFAEDLGDIKIKLASQIGWGFVGRGKKTVDSKEAGK